MPELTNRQRALLGLLNQLSQNNTSLIDRATTTGVEVDFPSVDFNVDFGGISIDRRPTPPTPNPSTPPTSPASIRELLLSLVNEQVEVTVPFGPLTGVLLAVRNDYIVLVEADGSQVLIRIDKIELVSEL